MLALLNGERGRDPNETTVSFNPCTLPVLPISLINLSLQIHNTIPLSSLLHSPVRSFTIPNSLRQRGEFGRLKGFPRVIDRCGSGGRGVDSCVVGCEEGVGLGVGLEGKGFGQVG
jgi:hypothetical protein